MQDTSAQQLSALNDDELTDFERRRLLDELIAEDANRATLARYQLIGEAMRQDSGQPLLAPGFFSRVSAAIDKEDALSAVPPLPFEHGQQAASGANPVPAAGLRARRSSWQRPLAGLALAASVALVSLWLAPQLLHSPGQPTRAPAVAAELKAPSLQAAPSAELLAQATSSEEPEWQTLPPEMEEKLNRYLVDHAEFAAGKGMDRMLPYASFVSYDSGR
ncbi:MAG: hypothetical protein HQL47_02585 [Gammaproteobacteria bacterium]|nr:hypothetical protein [Gammaproteobacteria bacterium]